MPFPTTKVIHPGWSEHHQPVARGSMTAVCRIEMPGTGDPGWDSATESTTPVEPDVIIDDCPCRVQEIDTATAVAQAGQEVTERRYLVTLPADVPQIEQGAHLVVTAAGNDSLLVGHRMKVADVQYGSERFERDLICTDNLD